MVRKRSSQRDFERIGAEGCYFLSLIAAFENILDVELDIYGVYQYALSAGIIDEDCYVNSPDKLATIYLGGSWSISKEEPPYAANDGEIEILRYEHKAGMNTLAHFVLGDGKGNLLYDPYVSSNTVRFGYLKSKRILRRT